MNEKTKKVFKMILSVSMEFVEFYFRIFVVAATLLFMMTYYNMMPSAFLVIVGSLWIVKPSLWNLSEKIK